MVPIHDGGFLYPDSLRIGSLEVRPALLLAPMAGLTDSTFRRVVRGCGGVGLVVSEILSSEGLLRGGARMGHYLHMGPEEHPIALQISGSNPERAAEAARRCEGAGADAIDINMGCPASKVTGGRCGAALLRDASLAARIAGAVVKAVRVPVTVKMRLGWSARELTYLEVARALVEEGVAALTLHPRTRDQGYSGEARWPEIARLKAEVRVPVVGNGDVRRPEQALELWRSTGCEGVMIGRAAVKNPWIFRQVEELKATGTYREPTQRERVDLILSHFEILLHESSPRVALYRMKTFLGKYTAGLPGAAALRGGLDRHREPGDLLAEFREWAGRIEP